MRTAVLLITGFGLVVGGVVVVVLGALVVGIVAIVVGLLLKVLGFLLDDATPAETGRGAQTLGGRAVERPRAGIPVGRAAIRPIHSARRRGPAPDEAAHRRRAS